jgi:hypothetical protein
MHGFPCFEWLAVQIWIFQRNSNKQTKSNSYRKHFYNCAKMVHVGLHSVATYHKKFGWQNKKIKIYFVECQKMILDKVFFTECQTGGTRQRFFKNPKDTLCRVLVSGHSSRGLCRVPYPGHSAKTISLIENRAPPHSLLSLSHSDHTLSLS